METFFLVLGDIDLAIREGDIGGAIAGALFLPPWLGPGVREFLQAVDLVVVALAEAATPDLLWGPYEAAYEAAVQELVRLYDVERFMDF